MSILTKEGIQKILNDDWLLMDECEGLENCTVIKELARMALAAMDGEPHTDDELSNLLWYSQEATCHSDPNYYCEFQRLATPGLIAGIILELQERRKAAAKTITLPTPACTYADHSYPAYTKQQVLTMLESLGVTVVEEDV